MTDPVTIISQVCADLKSVGYTSYPRIVAKKDFDLSKFKEQQSDYEGVKTEWVRSQADGITDDGFFSTVAVPIDKDRFFVLECAG